MIEKFEAHGYTIELHDCFLAILDAGTVVLTLRTISNDGVRDLAARLAEIEREKSNILKAFGEMQRGEVLPEPPK